MNPMSAALKNRRMASAQPMMAQDQGPVASGMNPQQDPGDSQGHLESIVANLDPDMKSQLLDMLQKDAEQNETPEQEAAEGPDDDDDKQPDPSGQSKVTSGEKQALAEMAQKPKLDDALGALHDPKFDDEDHQQPGGLGDRIKMNISKLMKKK